MPTQLRIGYGDGEDGAFGSAVVIVIDNQAARPCTLRGYPSVVFTMPVGPPIHAAPDHRGGLVRLVTLESHRVANSLLVTPDTHSGCRRPRRGTLRFFLPGSRDKPLLLPTSICRHQKAPYIGPVLRGDGGVNPFRDTA